MFRREASAQILSTTTGAREESDTSTSREGGRAGTGGCQPSRSLATGIAAGTVLVLSVLAVLVRDGPRSSDGLNPPTHVPPVPPVPAAPPSPAPPPAPPLSPGHLPKVYTQLHLDISRVLRVSKFRSGAGHDYSDPMESCCSMKHYFEFRVGAWDSIDVFAPMNGTIRAVREEWAGTQLEIEAQAAPGLNIVIFHINVRGHSAASAAVVLRSTRSPV